VAAHTAHVALLYRAQLGLSQTAPLYNHNLMEREVETTWQRTTRSRWRSTPTAHFKVVSRLVTFVPAVTQLIQAAKSAAAAAPHAPFMRVSKPVLSPADEISVRTTSLSSQNRPYYAQGKYTL